MSESYLKTLSEELSKTFSANSVVGEPIDHEDKILIPIIKMGFVLGTGSGKGTSKEGSGEGEGGGGGGGIAPVALITIFKDVQGSEGIKVLPLKSPSRLPEVIEKAIDSFTKMKEEMHKEKMEETEEPPLQE